jgi:ABC-2 type transport system ATP-binding protein
MIDRGHLVLAGPIDQLTQRTGVMRVEVGGGPADGDGRDGAARALGAAIGQRGVNAALVDEQTLDIDTSGRGDDTFDLVRDTVAELGLRLYSLSTRHRSLDDLFVHRGPQ